MVLWKKRIIDLLDITGISRSEFAKGIGRSQAAINQMLDPQKNKSINSNTLIEICQYFNVSSDYILGLSDDWSTDYDIVKLGRNIGLKASTIHSFLSAIEDEERKEAINEIFCSYPANAYLLKAISDYFTYYPMSSDQITVYRVNDLFEEKNVIIEGQGQIMEKVYLKQIEDILIQTKRGSGSWAEKRESEKKRLESIQNRLNDKSYQMTKKERDLLAMKLLLAQSDFDKNL